MNVELDTIVITEFKIEGIGIGIGNGIGLAREIQQLKGNKIVIIIIAVFSLQDIENR